MRLLPSGSTSLLVELGDLDEVLALYAALKDDPPPGVVDIVPAARTVLLVTDPSATSLAEVVRRHTGQEWAVAFCGFAPGFAYMTSTSGEWDVPRRTSPRTSVPAGSVALAGEFTGVYPRESPGGWQLVGRTDLAVFDLHRDPPSLLRPGHRVRFVEVGPS